MGAAQCASATLARCAGFALTCLAGLLVEALPAKVLEDPGANYLALKLLQRHIEPIVLANDDFNHDTSCAGGMSRNSNKKRRTWI